MRHPGPSTLPSRLYGLCREPGRRGRSNRNREKRAVSSDQSDTSVRAAPSVSSLKKIGGASLGGEESSRYQLLSSHPCRCRNSSPQAGGLRYSFSKSKR
jgi:hypothetical protein